MQKDFYNSRAGLSGERELDYHLREFRPDYPFAILHDVYLQHRQIYFQIDTLLITPGRIILCEVKNIAGKLQITRHPTQFIKEEVNGVRSVLKSPIEELVRKKYLLTCWLNERKLKIPLRDFVVFAYQNELSIENTEADQIAFSYEMPNRLRQLQIEERYLNSNEIRELALQIHQQHKAYNPFPVAEKYGVSFEDMITGVFCANCQSRAMHRRLMNWLCKTCGYSDRTSHLAALSDWFCMYGPQITNKQARHLFQINNRGTVNTLLRNSYVTVSGNGRGAIHTISPAILTLYQPMK